MSAKLILASAKTGFEEANLNFFESVEDTNAHVLKLTALIEQALAERRVYPSFYREFLDAVRFRIPVHSTLSLRALAGLRAQLVLHDLARYRLHFDHAFSPRRDLRFRYGLLVKHLLPDPETQTIFGFLPKTHNEKYEVFVFILSGAVDEGFKSEIAARGATIINLPEAMSDQISVIRARNLDYLFFLNDVSAKYSPAAKLAFFRLARHSGVGVSTIMPVFSPFISHVIAGDYFVAHSDVGEYQARVLPGKHPGYSFRASPLPDSLNRRIEEALTSPRRANVTFFSGSNFWKVNGDVIRLWASVLREVPNSTLRLSMFPPHYAVGDAGRIVSRISQIFNACGISASRVEFLAPSKSKLEWYAELAEADIYLDSFPYSSLTSIHDAVQCGLPAVVLRGGFFRNCHAPAILNHVDAGDLSCLGAQEYVERCIELAVDVSSRTETRKKILANKDRLSDVNGFFDSFIEAVQS
jgi:predicted O-linked N-acetylglucosamine transferase (SPINDLY family)